ncbi:MAG TPA: PAS domain S-box protein [Verrucomicrobiae bacterium]|nr:PAS domain S-box protein [Verrucomicrobiae bacterium]
MKTPLPPDEAQRLETLREYDVLDTLSEQSFDDLTRLAAHICGTPMALVTLVDKSRQWFKSKVGVSATETPRDISFCTHTILHKDEVMEVRDAQADPRFVASPLVTADPHIRFYAGAPLVTPGGHALGALCVMDRNPRKLTDEQLAALRALSRHVVLLLELRKKDGELAKEAAERERIETRLRQQFEELKTSKAEADRLLALGQKSRRALLSVLQDEKLAAENMRKSEGRYHTLFDCAPDGIVIVDPKGYYLDVNASMCRMLGYAREEFIGLNATDIVTPAEIPHIGQALEVINNKSAYQREWQFRRKDGSVLAVDTIAAAMPDGNLLAIIRDITTRKRGEEELRWKTAFLEAQVSSSADGILVVDGQGKRILQNQRMMDIFHIPEEVAQDNDDTRMLRYVVDQIKNPEQFLERVQYLYAHPDEIGRDEVELVRGTILDRYSSPVRDQAGNYYGRIWAFRDITDSRKLEAQYLQAQKMEGIGQLAGGVAHDFNNILAVIQMQADLLKFTDTITEEQAGYAEEIINTVQSAASLTRQLLLFSRREVFQPRDLDLNESIANTIKMLNRILGENVRMQLKLPSQPMFIHADAGMVDQVLLNLVVNARDAMPNGGQLIIETAGVEFDEFAAAQSAQIRPGSFVRLSVSDSGCGIPPEIIAKIFEPFFTTKEVGKGTGLGLATVFGIVQQHQGWINVYSELNHGTTFKVYLPRLAKNGIKKLAAGAQVAMRGGQETILLAEDDPKLRDAVRIALVRLGYRILEASTGVKALEVWKQNRDEIRLLLTDLVMPEGMTGKDLAQRILQEDPQMKVIYMSGYSAEVVGKDFPLKDGVNFLSKPFQAVKLTETVRNCLDRV